MKAYALREEFQGIYAGGVLAVGAEGRSVDVLEMLESRSDGIIVTSDPELELTLDHYAPLKPVPVPDGIEPTSGYDNLTVAELRDEAKRRDLDGAGRASKAQLVDALTAHDERLAAGDASVSASPDNPVTLDDVAGDGEKE